LSNDGFNWPDIAIAKYEKVKVLVSKKILQKLGVRKNILDEKDMLKN